MSISDLTDFSKTHTEKILDPPIFFDQKVYNLIYFLIYRKIDKIESSNIYVVEIYDAEEYFYRLLSHKIDFCTSGTQKTDFFSFENGGENGNFSNPVPNFLQYYSKLYKNTIGLYIYAWNKIFLMIYMISVHCVCSAYL